MDQPIRIVVAEDDEDDRILIEEAFAELRIGNPVVFVEDGEALLECLRGEGRYAGAPRQSSLVLLDLNMPRMDGRTALRHIKEDPELQRIPVVVLTTSSADVDVKATYDLGVSSFITKPVTFSKLVDVIRTLSQYWLQIVRLPG